ncbi:DUF4091 domain-containing protein [Victivallis sp. Marseille-Q1083]|uniref:DUF4091 domain-containing protein n=1 Tax=Victivallis sp. Marseille-Q1083 TaxID=2717288 RepID=UPI0015882E5E|nr:DUF4091 domain-containing protein [Victivallis sp. Marseille-Q1083]
MHNRFLLTLLAALSAGNWLAAADWLLNDFETPEEIAQWRIRESPQKMPELTLNRESQFVTSGRGCGQFDSPGTRSGGPGWPAFLLPGDRMNRDDWRAFDEITFDVYNPSELEISLWLRFTVEGGLWHSFRVQVLPGSNHLAAALPELVSRGKMTEFQFFHNEPPEDRTLYIDNLRLLVTPAKTVEKWERLRSGLNDPERLPIREAAGRQADFAAFATRLDTWRQIDDPMTAAETLLTWRDELAKLEKECDDAFNRRKITEWQQNFPNQPWGYAVETGSRKVFRDEVPFQGTPGGSLQITLARHEYEAAQLVLRASQAVATVTAGVSDLTDPASGRTIDRGNIRIHPVGYVRPPRVSYAERLTQWYPDIVLTDLAQFDLAAEVWQPLWVEVYAPRDTAAGTYEGTITVHGAGMESLIVPLSVTVWDFTLPLAASLPNLFTYEANRAHRRYARNQAEYDEYVRFKKRQIAYDQLSPGARRLRDLEITSENLLLAHRCSPSSLYNTSWTPQVDDVRRWIDRGASCFNILCVPGIASLREGEPYPADRKAEILALLAAAVPQYDQAGLLPYAVIYGFDESSPNQYAGMRDIMREIKQRYPSIPLLTTAFDYSFGRESGTGEYLNAWCPLTPQFEKHRDAIRQKQREGLQIWYYTCCVPSPPAANLLLEQSGVAPRMLLGALAARYAPDGYLYYQTTMWPDDTPLVAGGVLTNQDGRSSYQGYNGDGLLLYAGRNGPLPSLRLKAIRDGLEDYEYFHLLQQLADEAAAGRRDLNDGDRETLRQLLAELPQLAESFESFDQSGNALLAYRRRVGDFLSRHLCRSAPAVR